VISRDEVELVEREPDGLLVDTLVPRVHEEDGALLVVSEGLGDAVRHRHHEHA